MAPVRYSVYIDSLAKFSHLDSPHYVHLENGVVIVQNDKIRTPSTLVERVELGQSVTVLGKPPLLGFKWKLPSGLMRKFQLRFESEVSYQLLVGVLQQYVYILPASSTSTSRENFCNQDSDVVVPSSYISESGQGTSEHDIGVKDLCLGGTASSAFTQSTRAPVRHIERPSYGSYTEECLAPAVSNQASASLLRSSSTTLKMPTPIDRSRPLSSSNSQPYRHPSDSSNPRCEAEEFTEAELSVRFAAFIENKRNIKLCEAVEKFWANSGMRR